MNDEQRVRTMAGWIGVEISRSRVRTPGKAGYGLYRVRGSFVALGCGRGSITCSRPDNCLSCLPNRRSPEGRWLAEWTEYAFTLKEIERAVLDAIGRGEPASPGRLEVPPGPTGSGVPEGGVPTRWTSAYRGSRNLGVRNADRGLRPDGGRWDAVRDESGALVDRQADVGTALVGEDFAVRSTVRSRQREQNAIFQAEHLERRKHGLVARYANKQAAERRRASES